MESTTNRFNQGKENLSRKKETVDKFNNSNGKNWILLQCPRTLRYDKEIKSIEGVEETEIKQTLNIFNEMIVEKFPKKERNGHSNERDI